MPSSSVRRTIKAMATTKKRHHKGLPAGETGQEALYLKSLSERQVPVSVKLRDGETVRGWIEYFDDSMVRLTREGSPNLFIYKHQIRSIAEAAKRREPRNGALGKPVASRIPPPVAPNGTAS